MSHPPATMLNLLSLLPRLLARPGQAARLGMVPAGRLLNALRPRPRAWGGPLRQLSIRITERCNLRCHTCGQWGDRGYLRHDRALRAGLRDLPARTYLDLLEQLAVQGQRPMLYLWGGESMLYPGTLEIIARAGGLGMPVSIATNGTRAASAAEDLCRAGLTLLQVSIDGPDAATHNACRPGATAGADNFATVNQALAAVRAARRRTGSRLPLIASLTTISQENQGRLLDIYRAFRDRVEVMVFYLAWWIDEARAAEHERQFLARFGQRPRTQQGWLGQWRPGDYARLSGQLAAIRAESSRPGATPALILPPVFDPQGLRRYYTDHAALFGPSRCLAVFGAAELNHNGDLSPCRDYNDYVVGNITETPLLELWNNRRFRDFRNSLEKEGLLPVCSRCCGLLGY